MSKTLKINKKNVISAGAYGVIAVKDEFALKIIEIETLSGWMSELDVSNIVKHKNLLNYSSICKIQHGKIEIALYLAVFVTRDREGYDKLQSIVGAYIELRSPRFAL